MMLCDGFLVHLEKIGAIVVRPASQTFAAQNGLLGALATLAVVQPSLRRTPPCRQNRAFWVATRLSGKGTATASLIVMSCYAGRLGRVPSGFRGLRDRPPRLRFGRAQPPPTSAPTGALTGARLCDQGSGGTGCWARAATPRRVPSGRR